MSEKKSNYIDAIKKYSFIQKTIYEEVSKKWSKIFGRSIVVDFVDEKDIYYVEREWKPREDNIYPIFDWGIIKNRSSKKPRAMMLSIYDNDLLCGLASSIPSKGTGSVFSNVTLNYIQGAPKGINPIKGSILGITLDAMYLYGKNLGKNNLYINRPLQGVVPYYEKMGFSLDKEHAKGKHLGRKI